MRKLFGCFFILLGCWVIWKSFTNEITPL